MICPVMIRIFERIVENGRMFGRSGSGLMEWELIPSKGNQTSDGAFRLRVSLLSLAVLAFLLPGMFAESAGLDDKTNGRDLVSGVVVETHFGENLVDAFDWSTTSPLIVITQDGDGLVVDSKEPDRAYIWTGGSSWVDNPPEQGASLEVKPGSRQLFRVVGDADSSMDVQLWVVFFCGRNRIGNCQLPIRMGMIDGFDVPDDATTARLAFRLGGKGRVSIGGLWLAEDLSTVDEGHLLFNDARWSHSPVDASFQWSLADNGIKLTLNEPQRKYVWYGKGGLGHVPENGLQLKEDTYYRFDIDAVFGGESYVSFWLIMFNDASRIGHRVQHLEKGKPIYFKTLKGFTQCRILMQFAGIGTVDFGSLSYRICNLDAVLDLDDSMEDTYYLQLRRLIDTRFSESEVARHFVGSDTGDTYPELLRRAFPSGDGKAIEDRGQIDRKWAAEFIGSDYDSVVVMLPEKKDVGIDPFDFDWAMDPLGDKNWQMQFQNLSWLQDYLDKGDARSMSIVAFFISSWVDHQMYSEYPAGFAWGDSGMPKRFDVVGRFVREYVSRSESLDLEVLKKSLAVMLSHSLALCADAYYPVKFPYNHSIMMDVEFLQGHRFWEQLRGHAQMRDRVVGRLMDQIRASYSNDGIHMENSPDYHFMMTDFLYQILLVFEETGVDAEHCDELRELFSRAYEGIAWFLQPNGTFVQFGDTSNAVERIVNLIFDFDNRYDSLAALCPQIDQVVFAVTAGKTGRQPDVSDRVFPDSGYAVFRDRWHERDSYSDMIVGHMTCNNRSIVHYHEDELSFSLYGYGTEIILDAGLYNYEGSRFSPPLNRYRYSTFSHNVMVVDGEGYDSARNGKMDASSAIVDYEIGADRSWVRATHGHYARLGVLNQFRTFVHEKPNRFLVYDEFVSKSEHQLMRLLHFHPVFSVFERVSDHEMLVSSTDPNQPTVIVSFHESVDRVEVKRGVLDEEIQGWHFPRYNAKDACSVMEIHSRSDPGKVRVGMTITILPTR